MVDFAKSLALTEPVSFNAVETFDASTTPFAVKEGHSLRVLCTDLISPVGFSTVIAVHNRDAVFGSEEHLIKVRADGRVSGQGMNNCFIVNPDDTPPRLQEFDVTFLYTDGSTDYDTTVRAEDAVGAAALAKEDFMVGHDGEPDENPKSIVVMRNRVATNFDFETKTQTFTT